jgi:hypothetical protein
MTVQQDFSVELVDATSKKSFKKFEASDGNVFYEVEPDADYLIKVQVVGPDVDPSTNFRFDIKVDGICLDYHQILTKKDGNRYLGLLERRNGRSTKKAFRFKVPSIFSHSMTANTEPFHGTVEMDISLAIYTGCKEIGDIKPHKEASGIPNRKKSLRTGEGKLLTCFKPKKIQKKYERGCSLHRIKVNYCTTVGLIEAGILPKPPYWEMQRIIRKRPPCTEEELKRAAPSKKIKIAAVFDQGILISPAREVELFDLVDDEEPYQNKPIISSSKTVVPVTPDNTQSA